MTMQHISSLQRIMHSVLTGRMLLQLRACEYGHVRSERSTELNDAPAPLEFVKDDHNGEYETSSPL